MRRVVLLAGGALLAAAGLFLSSGAGPSGDAPKAEVPGAPLAPPTAAPPEEVAAFEALAAPAKPAAQVVAKDPAALAAAELDLDKLTLVDGHYEAPTKDGRTAILTLDPELQAQAEKLLAEARAPRGAIVAMAPDGRILALAGRRTDEPKGGKHGITDFHLATDVWAPAASVFKLVTASALVGSGVGADDKVCYHGGIRSVSESNLRDDKHDTSCETLAYGVAHSNNAILGKLAYQHLEPTGLDHLARDFGLGGASSMALGVPATWGELALPAHKDLAFAQAAAGFTGSRLSVLGGAMLAATFADAGEQPVPRLVAQIAGAPSAAPAAPAHRIVSADVARAVGQMMIGTCEAGSAARSFGKHRAIRVAGKTGTLTSTQPFYIEHSWFVGFAPVEKPEIIVSVLLGNPESWHLRGHEAAKRLIDFAIRRAARSSSPEERAANHVR